MDIFTKQRPRTYLIYFLGWTLLAFFFFSQGLVQRILSRDPTPWWHSMVSWFTGMYMWAILAPLIILLGRRYPIERRNWARRAGLHLLFSFVFSIGQLAWESSFLYLVGVFPNIMTSFVATFAFLMVLAFHSSILVYFTILGAQAGIDYYRKYKERQLHASQLQTQLAHAQLSALKMQLQPHFLFNTLNAIMVLVRQQKGRQAEEMLARLSDLLRLVLEDVEAQEVPLRRELEYLKLYLSIEEVRFQDRLRVEISAAPAILEAAVPHMGLQPIVENAIRHGLGRSSTAGRIQIRANHTGDTLEIKVTDDGPGLPAATSPRGLGIGLSNTRARLHQLYGGAAKFVVENGESGGVVATMTIPFHLLAGPLEAGVMEVHAFDSSHS